MEAREYVTLTNSASKRALFPINRNVELSRSDDEDSLGHMSPLKDVSSPDRYSSPPYSPCLVAETPTKTPSPKTDKENLQREQVFQNVRQNLKAHPDFAPRKSYTGFVSGTPLKDKECNVLSPFKCLTQFNNINDSPEKCEKLATPLREFKRKRNVEETPDSVISKSDAAQKVFWKKKPQTRSPVSNPNFGSNLDLNSSVFSLIRNSFYKPTESKAKTSLFCDYLPAKKSIASIPLSKSHKVRNLNATYPGGYSKISLKRRKIWGEINCGVHHKIRKPKPKKKLSLKARRSTEIPVISPQQRVEQFVVNNLQKGNALTKESDRSPNRNYEQSNDANARDWKESDAESSCSEEELVPDPQKKFFKTNRTLAIKHKAVVNLVGNVRIKVHKGKMSLDSPARKKLLKKKKSEVEENLFEDELVPQHEIEQVKESVEEAIQKLTKELETPQSFDNSHIQSITSSTSSLALEDNDDVNCHEIVNKEKEMGKNESTYTSNTENAKYFPVFYKRKGLDDSSNLSNKVNRPLKKMRLLDENQYQIDAGQSRFRAVHCKECDTLYHLGDPEDEIAHYNIHNNISTFRFMGWKNERVVKIYPDGGRVIVVYPDDPKPWINKIRDVLSTVDKEMGFIEGDISEISLDKVYLYVLKHRIVGMLAARCITEAFKMLDLGCDGPDCCSEDTYPVKCGISRIWVAQDHRRKKVATSLLNCMRLTFMFDHILAKPEIAFSVPTEHGKAFAINYMQTREFMVYYK